MTPQEFAKTLKGKVKYRFYRALFKNPTTRAFNPENPFLTSFDTHKSAEGNAYWYEVNKAYLAGEPLITLKVNPEYKYIDAPKHNVMFTRIEEYNGAFNLVFLAYCNMGQDPLPEPFVYGQVIDSSEKRRKLKRYDSKYFIVEVIP
jgi:hypothetical protein